MFLRFCVSMTGGEGCELLFPTLGEENKFNKKILNKEGQKTKVNTTTFLECQDSGYSGLGHFGSN